MDDTTMGVIRRWNLELEQKPKLVVITDCSVPVSVPAPFVVPVQRLPDRTVPSPFTLHSSLFTLHFSRALSEERRDDRRNNSGHTRVGEGHPPGGLCARARRRARAARRARSGAGRRRARGLGRGGRARRGFGGRRGRGGARGGRAEGGDAGGVPEVRGREEVRGRVGHAVGRGGDAGRPREGGRGGEGRVLGPGVR